MALWARILAGIGLHSMAMAGLAETLVQQLWMAEHVVLCGKSGVRRVLKGAAATLRTEDLPVAGESVLVLLQAHRPVASYPLDRWGRFSTGSGRLADVEAVLARPPFDTRGCQAVTRRGDYVLCTEILHAGTRSQGRRGRLYGKGLEIIGERKGQVVETVVAGARVRFLFLGNERPHLWSVSGWDLESGK